MPFFFNNQLSFVSIFLITASADSEAAIFLQTAQEGHLVIGTVFDEATKE